MQYPDAVQPIRAISLVLLCVAFAACSTMQKSSSGQKTFEPESTAPPAAQASWTQVPAAESPAEGAPATQATKQSEPVISRAPGAGDVGATTISSEEVASEKRQLAEEQEKINRLREEQEIAGNKMDEEAARRRASEAPASAPAATAAQLPQSRVAAAKADDQIAVFPADRNASSKSASPDDANQHDASQDDANQDDAGQSVIDQPLQRSVYFDFDKSLIRQEYDPMLKANAAFLKSHPEAAARVEGNCDERGSREYNLALGARRAEAVKRALEILGVESKKIKTVSFGSEKPIALGADEQSYSRNRRADIVN